MKLDLMNSRLDIVKKCHHIHDSVDDTIVHPICTAAPKVFRQSSSFSLFSKDGTVVAPTKIAESQRFESARMNSKGKMITVKECSEKNPSFLKVSNWKPNEFDLLNNHTASITLRYQYANSNTAHKQIIHSNPTITRCLTVGKAVRRCHISIIILCSFYRQFSIILHLKVL